MHKLINVAEASSLRSNPLEFQIGDTVEVHTRILEGGKERIQIYSGVVTARRGRGTAEMFTVRRIVAGEGVERTFPIHSPKGRQDRRETPRPRSPREALLLAETGRQIDPVDGTARETGRERPGGVSWRQGTRVSQPPGAASATGIRTS